MEGAVSVADLMPLVPVALELVKLLRAGDVEAAERKAKALAQEIGLKRGTRAVAKATKKAVDAARRR
jgi:hypothetical protein